MSLIEKFANYESGFRKHLTGINPWLAVFLFSNGRKAFLNSLINSDLVSQPRKNSDSRMIKLWDISFRSNLFNAAGMFKYGTGYELCAYQGAGAYLCGTTTASSRFGNKKNGILHPFAAFPESKTAINWMGLPNEGHEIVAKRLSKINKSVACPIGASIASSPEDTGERSLNGLLEGLQLYDKANVDFIELNESCPNVEHESSAETINGLDKSMVRRLEFISGKFLKLRTRNLPVIGKFSVDTDNSNLPALINLLIELKFDGINFGNTSTRYVDIASKLQPTELDLFHYFTSNFGGGVSGFPLKNHSLRLASEAVKIVEGLSPLKNEFHVIRTGGIDSPEDLISSAEAGISLNQWFTGYFESFSRYGHSLYDKTLQFT